MAAAIARTHGILPEAGGFEATAAEATVLLLDRSEDAGAIASLVWWAFCQAGAEESIGVTWCTGSDDPAQPAVDEGEDEEAEQVDDVDHAIAAIAAGALWSS